ncbi:MAG: hypothetical protein NTV70_03990 [Acidobacteria bacterium]|nr:hypothetical protein [Acidobacteriota bacterium]
MKPWIAGALVVAALFLGAVEVSSRVGLRRISKIYARIADEYRGAVTLRPGPVALQPGPVVTQRRVLFVGNSLLNFALKFEQVKPALEPGWDARRLMIEQTSFYDWYYGLRRLFAEGSRPEVVVLTLTPRQVVNDETRGDRFAYEQMLMSDLPEVAQVLHLHPTNTAGMAFAHLSSFYGNRSELRKVLLGRLMPGLPALTQRMTLPPVAPLSDAAVVERGGERLRMIREMTDAHGARLILVVPPTLNKQDGAQALVRAGKAAGVTVLVPVASGSLPPEMFWDGYHLGSEGAQVFTSSLIPLVQATIAAP